MLIQIMVVIETQESPPQLISFCCMKTVSVRSHSCNLQLVVTLSTPEAEYIAAGVSCTELVYLKSMMEEYDVPQEVVTL